MLVFKNCTLVPLVLQRDPDGRLRLRESERRTVRSESDADSDEDFWTAQNGLDDSFYMDAFRKKKVKKHWRTAIRQTIASRSCASTSLSLGSATSKSLSCGSTASASLKLGAPSELPSISEAPSVS